MAEHPDPGAGAHDYSEGPPVDFDVEPLVEPWHGKAGDTRYYGGAPIVSVTGAHNVRDIPPDELMKRNLSRLLRGMPFVGLVRDVDLPDPAKTDDLFIAATYDWLQAYRRIIAEQSDDFTRQAHVMRRMKDERAMVRAFFGLSTGDYS